MNYYSRYFSTNDNLTTERIELKPKLMRSTSLQDGSKSCVSKTTLDFSSPFSFEEVGSFEPLKSNSVKAKKSTEIKYEENKEEREPPGRNGPFFGMGRKQSVHTDNKYSSIRRANICTTVKPQIRQYCQCFKENSPKKILNSENGKNSEKFQNQLQEQLDEDIPSEIKCAKCHLEIQEEWRQRKMVIESWMEFFGSRGTMASNSIYTSASSV